MIKKPSIFLCITLIFIDRLSKYLIYHYLDTEYIINSFLSLNLTYNRGIAWGFFNSGSMNTFYSVTILVISMYLLFSSFTFYQFQKNDDVLIEYIFILTGGISNIIDRFIYHGVIDFILFHWGSCSWPAFNIADALIVIGILVLGVKWIQE